MSTDEYTPGTSRTAYYPSGSDRISRLWATEKLLHDFAAAGFVNFFEGGGSDPTVLTGYNSAKLWLNTDAGVTEAAGTIRRYTSGDATDIANWPALDEAGYMSYISNNIDLDANLNVLLADTRQAITSTGSAGAYVVNTSTAPSALDATTDGFEVLVLPNHDNPSGGTTLQIDALAALPLRQTSGANLPSGIVVANRPFRANYRHSSLEFLITANASGAEGTQFNWSKGADVASAAALDLGTDGNSFDITGTTAITSINTLGEGTLVLLQFDDALTLTHNATSLVLPGGADITTAAGDNAFMLEYSTGNWRCVSYQRADGLPVGLETVSQAEAEAGTATTPRAWTAERVQQAISALGGSLGGLPVGSTIAHSAAVPTGFLECDGSAISRTTYADLFAVIGVTYGSGDGSTTFNIPDYRGEFLRGKDSGSGNDPDAATRTDRGDGTTGDAVGTVQSDAIRNITGTTGGSQSGLRDATFSGAFYNAGAANRYGSSFSGGSFIGFDASLAVPTASDNRPRNVSVIYCIKY